MEEGCSGFGPFGVSVAVNGAVVGMIPYPPSLNRYWRNFRGRMVLSSDARAYKAVVRGLFDDAGMSARAVFGKGVPVSISLSVNRPRKSGDLDNTLKAIFDALNGLVWDDDSQVVEIKARRFDDKSTIAGVGLYVVSTENRSISEELKEQVKGGEK